MADARVGRLTTRIAKGLLLENPAQVDPLRRREAWRVAGLAAELLSRRGPAWSADELRWSPEVLDCLEGYGLATRWVDRWGGEWVVLTQRAADLGRRVPSSDGGLRDSLISRSVAIGRDKPEGMGDYARELARRGSGLFARARWAS